MNKHWQAGQDHNTNAQLSYKRRRSGLDILSNVIQVLKLAATRELCLTIDLGCGHRISTSFKQWALDIQSQGSSLTSSKLIKSSSAFFFWPHTCSKTTSASYTYVRHALKLFGHMEAEETSCRKKTLILYIHLLELMWWTGTLNLHERISIVKIVLSRAAGNFVADFAKLPVSFAISNISLSPHLQHSFSRMLSLLLSFLQGCLITLPVW